MTAKLLTRYRWAKHYIKGVRFFALLYLLIGVMLSAIMIWKGSVAYKSTRYLANPAIASYVANVKMHYENANNFLASKGVLKTKKYLDFSTVNSYTFRSSAQLRKLEAFLTSVRQDIGDTQDQYYAEFTKPIDTLIDVLLEHSQQIRNKLDEPKKEATPRPISDDPKISSTPTKAGIGLYSDALSTDEVGQVSRIRDILLSYKAQTSKENTRSCLESAIKALELYETVMKMDLPVPVVQVAKREDQEYEKPVFPKTQLKVDELVQSLKNQKGRVRTLVLTNWNAVDSVDALLAKVHLEIKEANSCEFAGQGEILKTIIIVFYIILSALLAAFFSLVFADFLQAIIDTPDILSEMREPK